MAAFGKISLSIDGKNIGCIPGSSILEAARAEGIRIPTLCYHRDLKPFGACRLCLVEEENSGRVVASCVTPAAPGMVIRTDSPRILKHRQNVVRLMMSEHPESCLVCSKGNQCRLRQIAAELNVGLVDLYPMPNYKPLEQANPFIIRDLSKCILCGMCIRADHELVEVGAIDYNHRGFTSRPATVHELGLECSTCTFCGTCVSICPTGALSIKNSRFVGTPEREVQTICGFCGVGCSLTMGVAEDRVVEVNPSRKENTVNGSTLCVRGHFAHDFLDAGDRLTRPMVRREGQLVEASWDDALGVVADRLLEIKTKNGPQSVAFLGSSKCTNEENYLFQKIARVLLETNNVDNGGYLSARPISELLSARTGGERRNPLVAIEKSEALVVWGADPAHSLPVVSYYVKRAARKGTPLLVVDPRKEELGKYSALCLHPRPASDAALIQGLASLLVERNAFDLTQLNQYTEGFDEYRRSLQSLDFERGCQETGVDVPSLKRAADLLVGKKITFLVGHGILQQRGARQCMEALINLALMTGSLGVQGGGVHLLAWENNQVGAWDMGAVPESLPGREPLGSSEARSRWERLWKSKISPDQGLNMVRMIEEAERGTLSALYVMGENPLRSLPQPERVRRALGRLEFLVVQDILESETSRMAHVVLPGAAFSEKGGSFTNLEGRVQLFGPVVPPPGDARPDWEILETVGARMGAPWRYRSPDKIREEIGRWIPTYEEVRGSASSTWVTENSQKALYNPDGKGDLIPFTPASELEEILEPEGFPFTAILGSRRWHLGSGSRTSRSNRIAQFGLKGAVEMAPEDGGRLNLNDGDLVKVASPHGSFEREVRLQNGLQSGMIFVPTGYHSNNAFNLIGLTPLGENQSPGWKTCRVKVEKL